MSVSQRAPRARCPFRLALVAAMALSASAIAQTPEQQWPIDAYRVDWEEAQIPPEAAANLVLAVPVTLRNTGNRLWPASQVFVGYHWFRDDKVFSWDGERSRLPRDLRAGGRATLAMRVRTPDEPGSYVLQITLVHELVTWFEHKGASTIVRPMVVRAMTTSIDGGRASQPCP